jgi:hypothetical protein
MLRSILWSVCLLLALTSQAKIKNITTTLFFETNVYELDATSRAKLYRLKDSVGSFGDFEIYIEGHTDAIGSDNYNVELSKKRSIAVQEALEEMGFPNKLINVEAFGEHKPKLANSNEQNRQVNRRVEVSIRLYHFESVEELEEALNARTRSVFTLKPNQANELIGRKGVKLSVKPSAFLDSRGKAVKEDIELTLTEAINYEDFAAHNLATLSNNRLLVSDGMVQLEAKSLSGKTLTLDPNKPIEVEIPTDQKDKRMQVFLSESGADWTLSEQNMQDIFFNACNSIRSVYMLEPLPIFEANLSTRPSKPQKMSKPKPPRLPNELKYKRDLKWFERPFAWVVKKDQDEAYQEAMERYQKHQQLYQKRYDIFVEHHTEMPMMLRKYETELSAWKKQRLTDSLAFVSSEEYLNIEARNARKRQLAYEDRQKQIKEWNAAKRKKLDEMGQQADAAGKSNATLVNAYVTSMSEMSWINIDRFYKMPERQARMIVLQDVDETPEKAFLVFREIKSLLPLIRQENGTLERDRFPKNERTALLAYKVVDGKTMVYYEDVKPQKKKYKMAYQPYTFAELKELLSSLQQV